MQRAIVCTLLVVLSPGVLGTLCPAGYKHKADLAGKVCATNAIDGGSCSSCCEKDKTTCGGIGDITCAWDQYAGNDDVWKNTKTTEKTKNTDCCTTKVTCSNTFITLPAGKKSKAAADVQFTKCSSDAKSCTEGDTCVEWDIKTCGGNAEGAGAKKCTTADKAPSGTDAAWYKKASTAATFDADCCKAALKCKTATGIVCAAAAIKVDPAIGATVKCEAKTAPVGAKGASKDSTLLSDCGRKGGKCCLAVKDTKKCGGWTKTVQTAAADKDALCYIGHVQSGTDDTWKNKACEDSTSDAAKAKLRDETCCVAAEKCSAVTCASGHRPIPNLAATTICGGAAGTCTGAGVCCQLDPNKCGGLTSAPGTGLSCAYGTFDERITWDKDTTQAVKDAWNNKAANSTNKNTNCCTAVAKCALPVGTTTPAATATPALGLKFSEHKVRTAHVEEGSWGTDMTALGVGGLIGMSVLMVVQALRSRMQTVTQDDAREDADRLLDTLE